LHIAGRQKRFRCGVAAPLRILLVGGHVPRRVRKQRRNSSVNRSGTSSDAKMPAATELVPVE
jgi:hypothetical protein